MASAYTPAKAEEARQMTAVVGLIDDDQDHVIIGADSASIEYDDLEAIRRHDGKVFKVGHLIVGVTGSYRIVQALKDRAEFGAPPRGVSAARFDNWMGTTFLTTVEQTLHNTGAGSHAKGAELLVAYQTHLYRILLDSGQYCRCDSYEAIGSGGAIALGSLYGSHRDPTRTPMQRAWLALEAASHHNAGVRPPFRFYSTRFWFPETWELAQSDKFQARYGKEANLVH